MARGNEGPKGGSRKGPERGIPDFLKKTADPEAVKPKRKLAKLQPTTASTIEPTLKSGAPDSFAEDVAKLTLGRTSAESASAAQVETKGTATAEQAPDVDDSAIRSPFGNAAARLAEQEEQEKMDAYPLPSFGGSAAPAAEPEQVAPVAHDDQRYDVQQKFDLAKAYDEMGDKAGAHDVLQEILREGDEAQQNAAADLLRAGGAAPEIIERSLQEGKRSGGPVSVSPGEPAPEELVLPGSDQTPPDFIEPQVMRRRVRGLQPVPLEADDDGRGKIEPTLGPDAPLAPEPLPEPAAGAPGILKKNPMAEAVARAVGTESVPLAAAAPNEQPYGEKVSKLASVLEKITGFPRATLETISKAKNHLFERTQAAGARLRGMVGGGASERAEKEKASGINFLGARSKEFTKGVEKAARARGHLAQRNLAFAETAKKWGAVGEAWFKRVGEAYNNAPLWQKIALGGLLAGGTFLSGGGLAYAFAGGVALQRFQGFAGSYAKFEKMFQSKARGAAAAVGYTIAMSGAIGGSLWLAKETGVDQVVQNWLRDLWPSARASTNITDPVEARQAPVAATQTPQPAAASAPAVADAPQPSSAPETPRSGSAVSPQPERAGSATAPESGHAAATATAFDKIKELEVKASPKGFVWMAGEMWQQMKDLGLTEADYPPGSDAQRLLSAAPEDLQETLRKIAERHNFYREDGSSILISKDQHLSFRADGELHLTNAKGETMVIAADDDKFTRPKASGAAAASPAEAPVPNPPPAELRARLDRVFAAPIAEQGPAINPDPSQPGVPAEVRARFTGIETPPIPTIDVEPASALEQSPPQGVDATTQPAAPAEPPAPAAPAEAAAQQVVNQYGETVRLNEAHVYDAGEGKRPIIFGGSPGERAEQVLQYLKSHPGQMVETADDSGQRRLAWGLVEGELIPAPVRTPGFFGIGSTFAKPPTPDDLRQLIK